MRNDPYTDRVVELVDSLLKYCNSNYAQAAAKLIRDGKPMSRQAIFKMVKGSGSLRVSTLLEILDAYGVELQFVKNGQTINVRNSELVSANKKVSAKVSAKPIDKG